MIHGTHDSSGQSFDPVRRAADVAASVSDGDKRKYRHIRASKFYGGIATADCVGCCLRCVFCWSWKQIRNPERYGRLYSPAEVADTLASIARAKGFERVRISGNEPTLHREHLLGVLDHVPRDLLFVLETNGILIGNDPSYATDLARFPNLYVRVSLKGATADEFSRLSGAEPHGFSLQIAALENRQEAGVAVHPAVMVSFSTDEDLQALRDMLAAISPRFADVEVEDLALYGDVQRRLKRAGIKYFDAYDPR